ncbi:MAG: hypothetical protein LBC43_00100 [Bifidobacteriaceae bacterium]|jgi:hypothetical protein|nr:hypothetical protein [Bifidobacteriaceae bacterium]
MMKLSEYLGKQVQVVYNNGRTITGYAQGFNGALDNDDTGEDELDVWTSDGSVYRAMPSEIASINVLESVNKNKIHFKSIAAAF